MCHYKIPVDGKQEKRAKNFRFRAFLFRFYYAVAIRKRSSTIFSIDSTGTYSYRPWKL